MGKIIYFAFVILGVVLIICCTNRYKKIEHHRILKLPAKDLRYFVGNNPEISYTYDELEYGGYVLECQENPNDILKNGQRTVVVPNPGYLKIHSQMNGQWYHSLIECNWGEINYFNPVFKVDGQEVIVVDWKNDPTRLYVLLGMFLLGTLIAIPLGIMCGDGIFGWASGL